MSRVLSPYEQNQLKKCGLSLDISYPSNIPIEYLTQRAGFLGNEFVVNRNVLIPRIETEQIIKEAYGFLKDKRRAQIIADVGCGSGCVGISLYLKMRSQFLENRWQIYFSDISQKALMVTKKNIQELNGFSCLKTCKVIQSNLFTSYPPKLKFDLILANLPYIPSSRLCRLPKSVVDFEPKLAIDGGRRGLSLIYKLLKESTIRLKREGLIILEIDSTHSLKDFTAFSKKFQIRIEKDQFGKNRFLLLNLKGS